MTGAIVVTTTAASQNEAERLALALLEGRLAACVQMASINSRYLWKGEVVRDAEVMLLIKTRAELFDRVAEAIRGLHSYENPEIVAMPVTAGSLSYLQWIDDNTEAL